ncbi:MAG: cell wall hydrolase [Lachnospiraceae bacterium]|nr:cell wall hydrolase [Lachnospiraceae bacterium]
MYKKYIVRLFVCNILLLTGLFMIRGIQVTRIVPAPAFQLDLEQTATAPKAAKYSGVARTVSSGQRVVSYEVLEKKELYKLSKEDYECLLRIVEAEAGCEDEKGKMLVAGVVLNRVNSDVFPDTVREVVFQNEGGSYQFSPVANGSYYKVKVSDATKEAVDKVLNGEDVSKGALYFVARKHANPDKMSWFDSKLKQLFSYGGHEFFTSF